MQLMPPHRRRDSRFWPLFTIGVVFGLAAVIAEPLLVVAVVAFAAAAVLDANQ